jgi:hypothetical protein
MVRMCTGSPETPAADRRGTRVRYTILLALLLWPAVSAADFQNGGFEQYRSVTPYPDSVPLYWRLKILNQTAFGSEVPTVWKTENQRCAGVFSRTSRPVTAGSYQGIWQDVDLTGIASIVFDARLAAYGSTTLTTFDNCEASLLVDDVPLWTRTADGTYLNQQVDVSRLPGLHRVELRNTARVTGQFDVAYWTQWDNLRLLKMPEETIIEAVVEVDPNTLNLNSGGNWITCYIELPTGYDVNDIYGDTVTIENVYAYMGKEGWAVPQADEANTMDHDGDGVLERMVKFDRSAVAAALKSGVTTVTVMGKLPNHTVLHGTDVLKVVGKGSDKK